MKKNSVKDNMGDNKKHFSRIPPNCVRKISENSKGGFFLLTFNENGPHVDCQIYDVNYRYAIRSALEDFIKGEKLMVEQKFIENFLESQDFDLGED